MHGELRLMQQIEISYPNLSHQLQLSCFHRLYRSFWKWKATSTKFKAGNFITPSHIKNKRTIGDVCASKWDIFKSIIQKKSDSFFSPVKDLAFEKIKYNINLC